MGSPGPAGTDGAKGVSTLVSAGTEDPGKNCAAGGVKLSFGADTNGNGVLDSMEVTSTSFVCNGMNGGASRADAGVAPPPPPELDAGSGAHVVLNEVAPNIGAGADLVELSVVSSGTLDGIRLQQDIENPLLLAILPPLSVVTGDLIVVHLGQAAFVGDSASKQDCTSAACYADAWDVAGNGFGISFSNHVLAIASRGGVIEDAVPFALAESLVSTFPSNLQAIQASGLWSPRTCAGQLCDYTSSPTAIDVSARWDDVGNLPSANTVQRSSVSEPGNASEWTVSVSTLGAHN